ncbi:FxDxF family PEP-CTERM protein [Rugamonas rubra]|uniref:PEP-CTERM protein-sorting domain-containing protein n=1 Tax=Rugamonas rubra TaxID=758825 RepID=A0A1I4M2V0_9BURK|nr:FxDxF family PEP-CTERM protein [Rugamonas rubra]SFL97519.1 PEP-CTERM protein-sorting domain-containing protein [Rugamonas rubra]
MRTSFIRLAAAATLLAAGAANADTNLVVNGSFEAPLINTAWTPASTVPGWTSSAGGNSAFEIQTDGAHGGNGGFNSHAADGQQYLELNTDRLTSITQNVTTSGLATYTLSFAYAGRPDTANGATSSMNVYWGGQLLNASPLIGLVNNSWSVFTLSGLHAAGASTELKFESLGPLSSPTYGSYLDNVSVTAAVPEPETYAMMLLGMGIVGFIARRKKTAKA